MAKKLLNRADIVARLQQVCGKTVAKSVTTGGFVQAGSADRKLDRVLEILFRDVMTARLAAARVNAEFRGREDVLPWPGARCIDVLPIKGVRQMNGTTAAGEILTMQFMDARKMLLERSF